ncbi:hypothetical protein CATYP_08415 [Corynebacterium atypicum]|uniref:nicotinamidase n=1 Tax=Corynebacterium atypicum TaxID=191610 RepID=A0ABM5QP84_9CORY|nr:hypothetical protein CATYP_08415 [Corynebacterium atypicum]
MTVSTLIIVDAQNDFCPGGPLATEKGAVVAHEIATALEQDGGRWDHVVATQDWHIDPGPHFSDSPDFVHTWPVHCRAESPGAELHEALAGAAIEEYFRKGQFDDGYSGFAGVSASGARRLSDWLADREVEALDVCGIATDFCVRATALDALERGFKVRVITDLCAAVSASGGAAALDELQAASAELVQRADLP